MTGELAAGGGSMDEQGNWSDKYFEDKPYTRTDVFLVIAVVGVSISLARFYWQVND